MFTSRSLSIPAGMHHEVGLLFALLESVRKETRDAILGMSNAELDHRSAGVPYSIANLLLHVAAEELWWIRGVLAGDELDAGTREEFAAGELGSLAATRLKGRDVAYYLGLLDGVRAQTEAACWKLRDHDLNAEKDDRRGGRASVRWILGHLAEHEAHHRGQIALLARLAGARPRGQTASGPA